MKQVRLERAVPKHTFEQLIQLYKEVKRTRDIHKILAFKSFIARMLEVQWDYDKNGRKKWATVEQYTTEFIMNKNSYSYETNTPLKFIVHMAENEHAYGYKIERDLRKTF